MSRSANRGTSSLTSFIECQRSIVSFDGPFDDLGFLSEKFRKMLLRVVRSQAHRLIGTSFVLKDAEGRALARVGPTTLAVGAPAELMHWYSCVLG